MTYLLILLYLLYLLLNAKLLRI